MPVRPAHPFNYFKCRNGKYWYSFLLQLLIIKPSSQMPAFFSCKDMGLNPVSFVVGLPNLLGPLLLVFQAAI